TRKTAEECQVTFGFSRKTTWTVPPRWTARARTHRGVRPIRSATVTRIWGLLESSGLSKAKRCIPSLLSRNDAVADGERGRLDRSRRRSADELAALALAHQTVSEICRTNCSLGKRLKNVKLRSASAAK